MLFISWALSPNPLWGVERFPQPEFESGYTIPRPDFSVAGSGVRSDVRVYIDVLILIITLLFSCGFVFKWRSRFGLYMTAVFSILYFGFYKKGCVCSVGAIQNVALALFQPDYMIPYSAMLFFLVPLVFALFFGRVFCSGVCPMGAIQEMVIYKPLKLSSGVVRVLSMLPYLYLGLAVLFAATGSSFIICKYDPFIGFYRLSAPYWSFLLGAGFLVGGIFIARPYCRFLCPYGILLGICSYFSKRHLSVTPDRCIDCRLCEDACPVDALERPTPGADPTKNRKQALKTGWLILLTPLLMGGLGFGFSQSSDLLARNHRTIRLAEQIHEEDAGRAQATTEESRAFREKGVPLEQLYEQAGIILNRFKIGAWALGCFLGLVFSLKLIRSMRIIKRTDYEPNRFDCVSCGRCMEYCPVETKLGNHKGLPLQSR